MNLSQLAHRAQKLFADNSPHILTGMGVVGTVSTAYLTGQASFKASRLLSDVEEHAETSGNLELLGPMTLKDKTKITWKLYIPAVSSGVFTIASIVLANRIGTRRAAALAAAYSLSEQALSEYKDQVVKQIGKNKAEKISDGVAQEKVEKNPPDETIIVKTGAGNHLCLDPWIGRYFRSDMEAIKWAINDINHVINLNGYASLNDLYDRLGLDNCGVGEDFGWNMDKLLDVTFRSTLTKVGDTTEPCMVMDFTVAPAREYFRYGRM